MSAIKPGIFRTRAAPEQESGDYIDPAAPAPFSTLKTSTAGVARSGVKPGLFLHATETAALDIRKACNSMKRMAAIASIAVELEIDAKIVTQKAEAVTLDVLAAIGYDTSDNTRMSSAIPMVMEAVCSMMAESARAGDDPIANSSHIAPALVEVAKSKLMARAIERAWPDDIDAVMAVNISAVSALTPVSLEALAFDFYQPFPALMKEVSKKLYTTVQAAVDEQSPKASSQAARLVFTQSLLRSGGRVMASVWRQCADATIDALNDLSDEDRKTRIAEMKSAPVQAAFAAVEEKFAATFGAMLEATKVLHVAPVVATKLPAPTAAATVAAQVVAKTVPAASAPVSAAAAPAEMVSRSFSRPIGRSAAAAVSTQDGRSETKAPSAPAATQSEPETVSQVSPTQVSPTHHQPEQPRPRVLMRRIGSKA